jgi:hypothetical protein
VDTGRWPCVDLVTKEVVIAQVVREDTPTSAAAAAAAAAAANCAEHKPRVGGTVPTKSAAVGSGWTPGASSG